MQWRKCLELFLSKIVLLSVIIVLGIAKVVQRLFDIQRDEECCRQIALRVHGKLGYI